MTRNLTGAEAFLADQLDSDPVYRRAFEEEQTRLRWLQASRKFCQVRIHLDYPKPLPGDVVIVNKNGTGRRAVIDGGTHYGPDFLMVVENPSAFRDPTRWPYVSVSGGPCPAIPPEELVLVGAMHRNFWTWRDGIRGAGRGMDYTAAVLLWAWGTVEDRRS